MSTLKLSFVLIAFALSLGFSRSTKSEISKFFSFWVKPKVEKTIDEPSDENYKSNKIQVALLLDTSGSMEGLIEQAKSQLWEILNNLSLLTKDGDDPTVEIALYEYGNPSKTNNVNQINQLVSFTDDVDLVSQKLFGLTTSGGEEYCGSVINSSLRDLEWDSGTDNLKLIYIAGNESFEQGPINYREVCDAAVQSDISINTIFCGPHNSGISLNWDDAAEVGNGSFISINQNDKTIHISTPYDNEITALNSKLNSTYIPMGNEGKEKIANQRKQDLNAGFYGESNMAKRTIYKSSKKYKAESWDLVDAYKKDKKVLYDRTAMPDSVAVLSQEELERRIEQIAASRELIKKTILDLGKKRADFLKEQKKATIKNGLEESIMKSIKKQATDKNYKIKNN